MKILLIAGASGHGKVIADIAWKLNQYDKVFFLDDDENIKECIGMPVIGKIMAERMKLEKLLYQQTGCTQQDIEVIIAIGNSRIREQKQRMYEENDFHIATLIHPAAVIGANVTIGDGTVVMAQAVINPDTVIGKGCIINTASSVDHDNILGDYCHVSVGSHLAGTVRVGKHTWIGAGAVVNNNLDICSGCMIGAGAVVVKNITESGTYVGVPAKKKV